MKRTLAVLVILSSCLSAATQTMSHEEEVVRNAYAKASLLCAVEPLTQAGFDQISGKQVDEVKLSKQMSDASPVFTLSDFDTGSIISIAGDHWGRFVTMPPPGTQILTAGSVTYNFSDAGNPVNWNALRASWEPFSASAEFINASRERSIAETLKIGGAEWSSKAVTYTRYVTLTVKATFQGKSVGPYQAIFFIGRDGAGQEVLTQNDVISGKVVAAALNTTYYPSFVNSSLRNTNAIAGWLRTNAIPASSCSVAGHDMCCSGGRCGISEADLQHALVTPLPPARDGGRP